MTKQEKREARRHAKHLLKVHAGVTRQTSPSKKRYKKLLNEFAVNIFTLNLKLQEQSNEQTGN